MGCENQTDWTEFVFLGVPYPQQLYILLFILFLLVYLLSVMGNILILLTVASKSNLQKPMYWFLCHLAVMDISVSTIVVPKVMSGFVEGGQVISFGGCLTQLFFYHFVSCSEFFLYTVMAYDRFLAICKPLHYNILMNQRMCLYLSLGTWFGGCVHSIMVTSLSYGLPYGPKNEVNFIVCEILSLLKLACSDTWFQEIFTLLDIGLVAIICVFLIVMSYMYIVTTILKIPSAEGRQRAFSTCSSHLMVVIICYVPPAFNYLRTGTQDLLSVVMALFYTTWTPFLNPLIYTLRNKEMKDSMLSLCYRIRKF
ncbi:olfactory receptor 10G6-like [Notechis scutatus]|uniref:Olfactory receptor 10G6-like n=1 Tax=Notechis scutatus TaxID=8663 RepID=A0A6J1VUW9_9SAUR|nr:olfactory receptor 10G6-like [Notechis scutatus]